MEHIKDLIEKVAAARREAWETAPRDSNHHLEAGMFVAMAKAAEDFYRKVYVGPEQVNPPNLEPMMAIDHDIKPMVEGDVGPVPGPEHAALPLPPPTEEVNDE